MSDVREKLVSAGLEIEGGRPDELAAQMCDDDRRYGKLIAEFGIRAA